MTRRLRGVEQIAGPALAGVLALYAVMLFVSVYQGALTRGDVAGDFDVYVRIGRLWLDTGQAYYPYQLTGTYTAPSLADLYPPLALYLFVPLAAVPPAAWWLESLWWAIPLGVTAWVMFFMRPARWSWPFLVLMTGANLAFVVGFVWGNTNIWSMAAVALAFRFAPASWVLAFKPSVWPLSLLFARRRSWWLAGGVVILLAMPAAGLWLDWLRALQHYRGPTLTYNLSALPMVLSPVLARIASTRFPVRLSDWSSWHARLHVRPAPSRPVDVPAGSGDRDDTRSGPSDAG